MRCLDPHCTGGLAFPCGKCGPCLFSRRGVWAHRMMLEASKHEHNSFVTLTYNDASLPADRGLRKTAPVAFIKRLRARGFTFRYFLCGEYGPRDQRPHYHAALFGFPHCQVRKGIGECSCDPCTAVRKAWELGFSSVLPLHTGSCAYIAGYVLKKNLPPPPALSELQAPFQLMSLKPGIGADAPIFRSAVTTYLRHQENFPDVLPFMKYGMSKRPLGRYLTERLRKEVFGDGYLSPRAKEFRQQKRLERLRKSLQDVYTAAGHVARAEQVSVRSVVQRAIHQENYQGAVNQAARSKRRETL